MSSFESILGKSPKKGKTEDVDFVFQKRRIDEAFQELLLDLNAFAQVEVYLNELGKKGEEHWHKLMEASQNPNDYAGFRELLWELRKKVTAAKGGPSKRLQHTIQQVQEASKMSLLRPPSPPVQIKNREEQETFRWSRVIALQESKLESLERKTEEYEEKIAARKDQRKELRLRSDREKEAQLNASHTAMVEIKLEGEVEIKRLREQVDSMPHFEVTPEYRNHLDQHQQKRKRIAKLELQLQLWIKKYDKFIGEPMASLEELEEKMAGLAEWRATVLNPVEDRMFELQEKIDVLEAIELEEMIEQMRKVHAVRVLQRAWKRTLEAKRAKKKSKKGKKK
ncbi:uncharacterized protein LOC128721316 [Anopheles nili]|uniref:uncharacterized protein LOC128721316 n=1 Tax=Anopheles nili TaxID=185578 RepID=UPI00237AABBE|nr:uncharacterized protein LOC128721316 [Anopheles nili]